MMTAFNSLMIGFGLLFVSSAVAEQPAAVYTPPPGEKVIMEPRAMHVGEKRVFTIETINGDRDLSAADFVGGKSKGYGDTLTFKPKKATPAQLKAWAVDEIIPGKQYKIRYAH